MKKLILASILLLTGCAAEIGPVKFAVGDAYVKSKDGSEVHGGHIGEAAANGFQAIWSATVGAAARVFGAAAQPTVIVAQPQK